MIFIFIVAFLTNPLRYFFSIIQFQIHEALCKVAGEYVENDPEKPMYNCDIDGNPAAGAVMRYKRKNVI